MAATKLTARQAEALKRLIAGGKVDKGMLEALKRKGALPEPGSYHYDKWQENLKKTPALKPAVTASEQRSEPLDVTTRNWDSLAEVRDRILARGSEEVISFDGIVLKTSEREFRMAFGELIVSA